MYFFYIDMGFQTKADTEAEAREKARQWFIEKLLNNEIEILIDQEYN